MDATSNQAIETGSFAPWRLTLWPPSSIRIVDWNIDRGLKLNGIIEFLGDSKADLIILQEVDLNARRTHRLNVAREIAQKLDELRFCLRISGADSRFAYITRISWAGDILSLAVVESSNHPI